MRRIAIRQSLQRHTLFLGAERELVMSCGLIALVVGAGGMTALSAISAITFWGMALILLRRMAKVDPMLSKVWLRHIKQQDVYLAKSSRWQPQQGGFKC